MTNQKGVSTLVGIIIILAVAIVSFGGVFVYQYSLVKSQPVAQQQEQIIGGDVDSHGCLGAAGYSWCEAKQKCLRVWEEPCEETDSQTAGWNEYTHEELMLIADKNWAEKSMYFKGLENGLLIIDQGTGPGARALLIYNLNTRKEIFSDMYSEPLNITDKTITYWTPTTQQITSQNCPESAQWLASGLGVEIEFQVSLNLQTLVKKDLGNSRCQPTQ